MTATSIQFPSFQQKIFHTKKQQKYFDNVTVIVNIVIDLSSSDEFSVATPDETAGKESEFSKDVVSLRNIKLNYIRTHHFNANGTKIVIQIMFNNLKHLKLRLGFHSTNFNIFKTLLALCNVYYYYYYYEQERSRPALNSSRPVFSLRCRTDCPAAKRLT